MNGVNGRHLARMWAFPGRISATPPPLGRPGDESESGQQCQSIARGQMPKKAAASRAQWDNGRAREGGHSRGSRWHELSFFFNISRLLSSVECRVPSTECRVHCCFCPCGGRGRGSGSGCWAAAHPRHPNYLPRAPRAQWVWETIILTRNWEQDHETPSPKRPPPTKFVL